MLLYMYIKNFVFENHSCSTRTPKSTHCYTESSGEIKILMQRYLLNLFFIQLCSYFLYCSVCCIVYLFIYFFSLLSIIFLAGTSLPVNEGWIKTEKYKLAILICWVTLTRLFYMLILNHSEGSLHCCKETRHLCRK